MTTDRPTVRDALPGDADACAAIYAPYVRDTVISFEESPPAVAEMAQRIAEAQKAHAWLVATIGNSDGGSDVIGYAYGHPFASRAAYRWSCETSIYLDSDHRGAGVGRLLYRALLERLTARGYRTALAGVSWPNPASEGLHRSLGFDLVGIYRHVGYKAGAWQDVAWLQRDLADSGVPPAEPR